jgi:hypothetical protein
MSQLLLPHYKLPRRNGLGKASKRKHLIRVAYRDGIQTKKKCLAPRSRDPNPGEIAIACKLIRREWTEDDERMRWVRAERWLDVGMFHRTARVTNAENRKGSLASAKVAMTDESAFH